MIPADRPHRRLIAGARQPAARIEPGAWLSKSSDLTDCGHRTCARG
jgi:hypothetical protein